MRIGNLAFIGTILYMYAVQKFGGCWDTSHFSIRVPYSRKFSHGANFCIFHMLHLYAKIKTYESLNMRVISRMTFELLIQELALSCKVHVGAK